VAVGYTVAEIDVLDYTGEWENFPIFDLISGFVAYRPISVTVQMTPSSLLMTIRNR